MWGVCCPAARSMYTAVTEATLAISVALVAVSMALFVMSCASIVFLVADTAARLSRYPSNLNIVLFNMVGSMNMVTRFTLQYNEGKLPQQQ